MYDKLCVKARSMPFWCVANPLGDPFGGPVQPKVDSLEIAQLIADTKNAGLIEMTSWHDDDLVPWDPAHPEDDLDPKSAAYAKLVAIRKILNKAGVKANASICSLHGHPMFRAGGLCNPDPKIRALAVKKVERTLRIGAFLGAKYYVYWVARDGFESYPGCDFKRCYDWLAEGLNHVTDYIAAKGLKNYIGGTVEPKPNEPRGAMFLPTSGHAVGFIMTRLKKPDFWGVNPELLQHEGMCLINSVLTVSYLIACKKLKFLHFGSQVKGQFDDDFPPLVGPEGLKETVWMFRTLADCGWKGIVEFDCHMLRCDGGTTKEEALDRMRRVIRQCSEAVDVCVELASRIKPAKKGLTQGEADLAAIRQMCKVAIPRQGTQPCPARVNTKTAVNRSRHIAQYVLVALFALTTRIATWAGDSCIVSGDTIRDAAASEVSVLGIGSWFDSSSFDIAITPTLQNFSSKPVGCVISFR